MTRTLPSLLHALLLAVLPGAAEAQKTRFVHRPPLPCRLDPERHELDRVVLKFPEGSLVRLRAGTWTAAADIDLHGVIAALAGLPVERYFTRSEEDLAAERAFILSRLPRGEEAPGELNLYYVAKTRGQKDSEALVDRLNALPAIEVAYAPVSPKAFRRFGDIAPPTPDFSGQQGYLGAAPNGTEAFSAFRIAGGRAQGHRVAHIEGDWRPVHEDIDNLATAPRVGAPDTTPGWMEHGTACVSLLNAGHNGYGVIGYGSAAGLVLSGIGAGFANAVSLASAQLQPGDVASSSFGSYRQCGGNIWAEPPEGAGQADFDAVKNLTGRGVLYTFAAGNAIPSLSAANFDDPCWGGIWDLNVRDSGAFLIAASASATRTRLSFSSYGKRIDSNGWGENVVSAELGDLWNGGGDVRQYYTATFGGTSAAAPMVAGVCAAYIGAIHEQDGSIPTPAQVRAALRSFGTPPADGSRIGNLPDLKAMLAAAGLPDGLTLQADPVLGRSLPVEIKGPGNGGFVLFAARTRGRTAVGLNRPFLLGASALFAVDTGAFGSGGLMQRTYPVPNDLSLRGSSLYLQSLDIAQGGALHLSNSCELLVP